jgi:hypothetical protein
LGEAGLAEPMDGQFLAVDHTGVGCAQIRAVLLERGGERTQGRAGREAAAFVDLHEVDTPAREHLGVLRIVVTRRRGPAAARQALARPGADRLVDPELQAERVTAATSDVTRRGRGTRERIVAAAAELVRAVIDHQAGAVLAAQGARLDHLDTIAGLPAEVNPDDLALATLAALQGGLLLAQVQRDPRPLAVALDTMTDRIQALTETAAVTRA